MSDFSQIIKLIEEEVKATVARKIQAYAQKISTRHCIPLHILLQDLDPDETVEDNFCLGVCNNGKRCKMRRKSDGYCRWHTDQKKTKKKEPEQPQMVCKVIQHTHSFPPLILKGCPACENIPKDNLLINI